MADFRVEFGDFDPATMPAIPDGWTDQSWHNDACPCFNTGRGLVVFVDYADASLREIQEDYPRFSVQADPEVHDHNESLLETDDWSEVLAYVAKEGK